MNAHNEYAPGTFNWADLATSDAEGAKAFYAGLFGWTAEDIPVGAGVFTLLHRQGREAASLYQLSRAQRVQGIPSHWMAYVAVTSADDTVRRAARSGARVLADPFDVLDMGRIALLLDPAGAPFAVWQAGSHPGTQVLAQPGALAWTELLTPDPGRVIPFYSDLFGWTVSAADEGQLVVSRNGQLQAGINVLASGQRPGIPRWRVYFAVADRVAAVATTLAMGGRLIVLPAASLPDGTAIIQDPQGAEFGVVDLSATKMLSR